MKKYLLFFLLIFTCSCTKQINHPHIDTIIEEEKNILVGMNYPTTNTKLDKTIEKDISLIYDTFKKKYKNLDNLLSKSELNIDYDLVDYDSYMTITLYIYINYSNIVTPINYIKTYIWDKKENELLNFEDIISIKEVDSFIKSYLNTKYPDTFDIQNVRKITKEYKNFSFDEEYLYIFINPKEMNYIFQTPLKIPISLSDINLKINIKRENIPTSGKVEITPKILDPTQKVIALTFDDGPSIYTDEILEILKENDCNATFFVLGNKVSVYQDTLKKSIQYGNEIGNHSYNHKWLVKLGQEELLNQIEKTQAILKETIGYTPKVFRPTYGSVNEKMKKNISLDIILWNVDTLDWKYKGVNKIVSRATNKLKDSNIILMHDIRKRTVNALKKIVPIIKKEGYQCVTISELKEIQMLRDRMYER